jgi:hypothetical protein
LEWILGYVVGKGLEPQSEVELKNDMFAAGEGEGESESR